MAERKTIARAALLVSKRTSPMPPILLGANNLLPLPLAAGWHLACRKIRGGPSNGPASDWAVCRPGGSK